MREQLRELAACHERAATAGRPLEGSVTLGILVSAAGRAQSVGVAPAPLEQGPALHDETMLRCLRARVAQWAFAPRAHITGVRLPLTFRAGAR